MDSPGSPNFLDIRNSPELISARTSQIRAELLRASQAVRSPNFTAITGEDLHLLFELYDRFYFERSIRRAIAARPRAQLGFRLSSAMTRRGGSTTHERTRLKTGLRADHYEIAVATQMLFNNFNDSHRDVTVAGLPCADRLLALQRIMEHEILHLVEMLIWNQSRCSAPRFKSMARNIFGHTDSRHQLITSREFAAVRHNLRVGSIVNFQFDGRTLTGLLNRIHHRATVLVESPRGQRYRNGKTYDKYYVPLPHLSPAPDG